MKRQIMVVDDSDSDLLFTRIVLERACADWQVLPFESARDALDFLRSEAGAGVEVVLLDINMPGMNGFEFLDAYGCGRGGAGQAAVVVMLTSSPDPADRERALAHGHVKGYITKPIDAESARGLARFMGG